MTENHPDIVVDISREVNDDDIPEDQMIAHWVRTVLRYEQRTGDIAIRIVDTNTITQFNLRFRDQDKPTNVLAFPDQPFDSILDESTEHGHLSLGDIMICAPVLAEEASEQGKPLHDHYAHIVMHATLHLLGYDHIEADDALQMETLEIQLLAGLNIANPYEPHTGDENHHE